VPLNSDRFASWLRRRPAACRPGFDESAAAGLGVINDTGPKLALAPVTMAQLTRGDGVDDLNLRLARVFRITGRMRAEVMLEAYDAFNHANYLAPNGTMSSPAFLGRTTALNPRQVQIAVRF
jgi:hypothetical protein